MKNPLVRPAISLLAGLMAANLLAQSLPAPKSGLSIERLNSYPMIHGRSPSGAAMSPDGRTIVFGWNKTGERRLDVWTIRFADGRQNRIIESDKIPMPIRQDDRRTELQKEEEKTYDGGMGGFQWAPDGSEILAGPYRGRVWRFKPDGSELEPLIDTNEGIGAAAYSPDGKYIAFLRGGNLFRLERSNGRIKQLTTVSKPGTSLDGFLWSPDSKRLALSWSDSTASGSHVMMDFTKDRAEVVPIGRMWNGERSVNVQIGIIGAEGGLIKFIEGLPRYHWTSTWDWSSDGAKLAYGWYSEDFQEWTISVVPAESGSALRAYTEKAPSHFLPDFRSLFWNLAGDRILFTTDIIGGKWANRSLMSCGAWGQDLKPVYAKNHDIAAAGRPKKSDRIFLVTLGRDPLLTDITILDPNGKVEVISVEPEGASTPVQFDDAGLPLMSDDGNKIATTAGHRFRNPELFSVLPSVKRLTESQLPDFKKVVWAPTKTIEFPGPDGKRIRALLTLPPDFKPGDRRPMVISNMYANSAKRNWTGYTDNYMAAELGMVVVNIDFRASWGYGGQFNAGYFKNMGMIDADEAVKAKEWLVKEGYAHSDKCAVWGWSYGGYLTCMIQLTKPGVFASGVAVASVTDWVTYNEWYTRRRLSLPSEDKDIYIKTSPVHHAKGLTGHLMLIHGMLDDNVLYQDTVRLQENLIREGKSFETFAYPRGDHGMFRVHERPHVFSLIIRTLFNQIGRN